MARVKYSEEVEPINNKHFGFTFQRNHYGHSMQPASKSGRFRRPSQNNRQQNNQKAIQQWRNMSIESKAAWNLFAAVYPQPANHNPLIFLTGYQLFLSRNSYCFLNHGIDSDFMYFPEMEVLESGVTVFELTAGDNTIDLTELYISNFGILPTVGQTLLFCAIPFSDISGQFFAPIFDVLTVQSIYVDGFFMNLTFPENSNNILYSVYLSKPVNAGQSYVGTKVRYMGCFTTKKFTALSDVPAVTPADSGKVWGVNPDGTWGAIPGGGGGGLTCEDLPACPAIIDINSDINILLAAVFPPIENVWFSADGNSTYRSINGIDWYVFIPRIGGATESCFRFIQDWSCWLCASGTISYGSADGLLWSVLPAISGFSAKRVDYNGNGLAVCVGPGATNSMYFSGNGKIWQGLGVAALGAYPISIIFAQNIWVAGSYNNGQANTMAYSYDGVTWVGLGKTVFTTECAFIAYGNGRFVAVGRGTVTAAYSMDGITWVRTSNVFGVKGWGVTYFKGFFVCTATNGVWKSADGITWELVHADAGSWGTTSNAFSSSDGVVFCFATISLSKYSYDLITWYDTAGVVGRNAVGCSRYPSLTQ